MDFLAKGHKFTFLDRYAPAQSITDAEAQALNRFITRNLQGAIKNGTVKSRADAEAYLASDACLEAPSAQDFDVNWEDLTQVDEDDE